MERFLTPEEVCGRYSVSTFTLYDWTRKGLIPHYKIRGQNRYKESDLQEWEKSNRRGGVAVDLI